MDQQDKCQGLMLEQHVGGRTECKEKKWSIEGLQREELNEKLKDGTQTKD